MSDKKAIALLKRLVRDCDPWQPYDTDYMRCYFCDGWKEYRKDGAATHNEMCIYVEAQEIVDEDETRMLAATDVSKWLAIPAHLLGRREKP